jgi:hypothetical protein
MKNPVYEQMQAGVLHLSRLILWVNRALGRQLAVLKFALYLGFVLVFLPT